MPSLDLRTATPVRTQEETGTDTKYPRGSAESRAEKSLLAWEVLEYQPHLKGLAWYATFGVALAVLVFAAFLMRSFLSGIVFVLLGILVLLYSERPPRTLRVRITPGALMVNDRRYLFPDLEAFNILESPKGMLALVRSKRTVMPLIHLPLADMDPEEVRTALQGKLPEDTQLREPLPDLLAHWIGF